MRVMKAETAARRSVSELPIIVQSGSLNNAAALGLPAAPL